MKERMVHRDRTIPAHDQASVVAEPREGAFHDPASPVAPQRPPILRARLAAVRTMRGHQLDSPPRQLRAQRITVVSAVGDHPRGLLSRSARAVGVSYPDRRECRLCEPDFVPRGSVKEVSQRKTLAVDHHHPLRPLAPLGFSDGRAPFLAGAKLPSRNDSLHCSCWRSFSSPKNARQMCNQTPCSSQSRSRRQQVDGDGNSSGRSCHRAPLRKIHRMPSSTLRRSACGRPPRGCRRDLGNRGRIFSHCASDNNRPYRGIRPPRTLFMPGSGRSNYYQIRAV